jgi:hypothetical protein
VDIQGARNIRVFAARHDQIQVFQREGNEHQDRHQLSRSV